MLRVDGPTWHENPPDACRVIDRSIAKRPKGRLSEVEQDAIALIEQELTRTGDVPHSAPKASRRREPVLPLLGAYFVRPEHAHSLNLHLRATPDEPPLPEGVFIRRCAMTEQLIHEGAEVFSRMTFKDIHQRRLNTEAEALHDDASTNSFVSQWRGLVDREFKSSCRELWSHTAHSDIKWLHVSDPTALMSLAGCRRQEDHTDFKVVPENANCYSVIGVIGLHARILLFGTHEVTLYPSDLVFFGYNVKHAGGPFDLPQTSTCDHTKCTHPQYRHSMCFVGLAVHSYFRVNEKLPANTGRYTYPA